MILAKEITVWNDGMDCNHTYLLNDSMDKMIGYFKRHNPKEFQKMKNPLRFDTRYRKFKILQRYDEQSNKNNRWKILGSKDHVYTVEELENGMVCSCVGFKYHGKCKHIDGVLNESK